MFLEQKYFNIRFCIYCGVSNVPLTDEHVIPFALNGKMVLKNASCDPCRIITSKYEHHPLHSIFLDARASLDYPSRNTKLKSKKYSQNVILMDGKETTINLSSTENLAIVPFPVHTLPGLISREQYNGGSQICGIVICSLSNITLNSLTEKYNVKEFKGTTKYIGINFENMIARIAYCYLIACFGPDCLKVNYILQTIMGKNENIGMWQGCDTEQSIIKNIGIVNMHNAIKVTLLESQPTKLKMVAVSVKFFASFNVPEYIVIVGEPSQAMINESIK